MLLQQTVNAVTLGCSYALVALGFALVFGVMNIFNMAHGAIAIFGAYLAVVVSTALHLSLLLTLVLGITLAALVGAVSEILVMRPTNKNELAPFVATLGLTYILEHGLAEVFGPDLISFPSTTGVQVYEVLGVTITTGQVLMLMVGVVLLVVLTYLVMRTQVGRLIRATAESRETAAFLGINASLVGMITIVLACSVGGAAGVLLGQYYGSLSPFLGMDLVLKAMVILIVGGTTSFYGSMVVALLLGFIEVYATAFSSAAAADMSAYVLLIVILLLRPEGLFGAKSVARD